MLRQSQQDPSAYAGGSGLTQSQQEPGGPWTPPRTPRTPPDPGSQGVPGVPGGPGPPRARSETGSGGQSSTKPVLFAPPNRIGDPRLQGSPPWIAHPGVPFGGPNPVQTQFYFGPAPPQAGGTTPNKTGFVLDWGGLFQTGPPRIGMRPPPGGVPTPPAPGVPGPPRTPRTPGSQGSRGVPDPRGGKKPVLDPPIRRFGLSNPVQSSFNCSGPVFYGSGPI